MLGGFLRTLFDDRSRGDDRAAADIDLSLPAGKPPVLRRRTINLIAILGIMAILYGTLMPFQIDQSKALSWQLTWTRSAPGDIVANVLIYVPIGAFVRLLVRRRGSPRLLEWLVSLAIVCGLSYLTEVAQTVVVMRVASWIDAVCNFAGACLGIAFGPLMQRMLRNAHAWLYRELRIHPMSMAAATAMICVCTYALAPLDLKPTPSHVAKGIAHLRSLPSHLVWMPGNGSLSPVAVLDKVISAGAYGLLAFLLFLSAREAARSRLRSAWYALSRAMMLALAIEVVQLFTISHVADPRDLFSGWLCCLLGCVVGWKVVGRSPEIHRAPLTLLQGAVAVISGVMLAWAVGSVVLVKAAQSDGQATWWPAVGNFHRSWSSLLGDYTSGLLQYTLVAGLLILWGRATHHRPRPAMVLAATLAVAVISVVVGVYRGYSLDTAQLLLALIGGIAAVRFDRAIFGKRQRPVGIPAVAGSAPADHLGRNG